MALATLSIDLEARLAKFEAGMDKAARLAERNAEAARASWARAASGIAGVAGGIAGAFAGFSIVDVVRSNIDALDQLNDVADATGASIENISALEDVARRTGTGIDTVSSALIKFNRELADAKADSPTALALEQIGLNAEELRRLDPAEALLKTAQALAIYEDDGDKARRVQELFGKSVKEIAPYLKDLAEQGQLNAKVTSAQAAEAERFNKSLYEFQARLGEGARALTSLMLPALNRFATDITNALQAYGNFKDALLDGGLGVDPFKSLNQNLGETIGRIVEVKAEIAETQRLRGTWRLGEAAADSDLRDLRAELNLLERRENYLRLQQREQGGGRGVVTPLGEAAKPSVGSVPTPAAAGRVIAAKADKPDFFGPDIPEAVKRMQQALDSVDSAKVAQLRDQLQALISVRAASGGGAVDEAILKVEEELGKFNPAVQEAAERQKRLNDLLADTDASKLEAARADMQLLAEAFERGTITAEQFNQAASARLGLADSAKPQIEAMDEMLKQFGRNIQDSLGSTIKSTLKGDFESIGQLWGNLLLDMAAQAAAARVGKELFGDLFSGGSLGGGMGDLLKIGAVFFGVPGFAAGGDHAGGLRLVGEKGPELEATGPARIFNASQTAQILRGGGGAGRGGGLQLHYAPVIQIDGRADRAQGMQDAQAVMRQGQRELLAMLKAKGVY